MFCPGEELPELVSVWWMLHYWNLVFPEKLVDSEGVTFLCHNFHLSITSSYGKPGKVK